MTRRIQFGPNRIAALVAVLAMVIPAAAAAQNESTLGQWTQMQALPVSTTHTNLLPNGNVLFWGEWAQGFTPYLWNPETDHYTGVAGPGFNPFCGGHTFTGDGQLFAVGGNVAVDIGFANSSTFDSATSKWTGQPDMNAGRWYPTATTLPNGDVFVISGDMTGPNTIDPLSEVFEVKARKWRELTGAKLAVSYYPRTFVQPDGKVRVVGPHAQNYLFDTTGIGYVVADVASHFPNRDYGSAVMYDIGKILIVGGGVAPTATAETIDLLEAGPTWKPAASMSVARRQLNATVLPDGTVLVNGGTKSGATPNDPTGAVLYPEAWDPSTNTWTKLAAESEFRGYHSTGLLLPDGRVLAGGGAGATYVNSQVFSPPYLFRGSRPTLADAPQEIWPDAQFRVSTPDAESISKVSLVRLGSVTHAVDMNQRYLPLQFTPEAGGASLAVTGPKDNNIAPAGHYMLFILDSSGVPSVAKIVHVVYGPDAGPAPVMAPLPKANPSASPRQSSPRGGCSVAGGSLAWPFALAAAGLLAVSRRLARRRRFRSGA